MFYSSGTVVNETLYPMLIKGSELKPYEQYGASPSPDYPSEIKTVKDSVEIKVVNNDNTKSQSAIMPIQQEMLEGDYIKDVEYHEWGKSILTGDEEIMYSIAQGDYYLFQIRKNDAMKNIPFVCNKFINAFNWGVANSRESINNQYNSGTLMQFKVLSSRLSETSANGVKLWLKAQYDAGMPVIVYYKLATPVDLELTEEQKVIREKKLHTYKNITNINLSDELASIDVTYKKDLETMFNNIIKQIPSSTSDTAET